MQPLSNRAAGQDQDSVSRVVKYQGKTFLCTFIFDIYVCHPRERYEVLAFVPHPLTTHITIWSLRGSNTYTNNALYLHFMIVFVQASYFLLSSSAFLSSHSRITCPVLLFITPTLPGHIHASDSVALVLVLCFISQVPCIC